MKSRAPLIVAIVLLLLPVLYVGRYFALVVPGPRFGWGSAVYPTYRVADGFCTRFFWSLEQIDRKVRPDAWGQAVLYPTPVATLPIPEPAPIELSEGIADLESVVPGVPTVYHLRNWHWVKKENFAANTGLEGEELDRRYEQEMKSAADVHASLKLILADVSEVYIEALPEENQGLVAVELHSLAAYHTLLRREALEDADHERSLLRLGAAAELLLGGKKIKLLPAEGPEYEAAKPVNGEIDDKLNAVREAAIVKRIVAEKKTALLVLGGDHDLTEAIKSHPGWGYLRVTPKGYPE